jgi:hypothetical protein
MVTGGPVENGPGRYQRVPAVTSVPAVGVDG